MERLVDCLGQALVGFEFSTNAVFDWVVDVEFEFVFDLLFTY